MKLVIGSRGSLLALEQSEIVKRRLQDYDPSLEVEIKVISTKGDRVLDKPLHQIGDKGLFTYEIEQQLLNGDIDIAVHSMKDMPSTLSEGLMFSDTIEADDAHDVLVFNGNYRSIDDLPYGAIIGTGSPRRKAQLLAYRPDLTIVGIRGNVQTRLRKMKEENMAGIVLACAGLNRLGYKEHIGQVLPYSLMVPACAQGILALEVKVDSPLLSLIHKISSAKTTRRMNYERLYLSTIGGSCHCPIGVHVDLIENGIELYAVYGNENCLYKHHEVIDKDIENRIIEIATILKEKVEKHG